MISGMPSDAGGTVTQETYINGGEGQLGLSLGGEDDLISFHCPSPLWTETEINHELGFVFVDIDSLI